MSTVTPARRRASQSAGSQPARPVAAEPLLAAACRTRLGWIAWSWRTSDAALVQLTLGHAAEPLALAALQAQLAERDQPTAEVVAARRAPHRLAVRLRAFAAGTPDDFADVPLATDHLTPFQARVLAACRAIPPGVTVSYAELAARAGAPGAARAVGNVMANNRVPLVAPCHRVVGSGGKLGGYSAPTGLALKRQLLALEADEE